MTSNNLEKDKFLYELLKEAFYNEYERLHALEEKSHRLLAVTGIILTFQGSLAIISQSNYFTTLSSRFILFLLSLLFYAISIIFFLKAYSSSEFLYIPDTKKIKKYEYQTNREELINYLITQYKKKFNKNKELLKNKNKNINRGILTFSIGILLTIMHLFVIAITI